MKCGEYLSIVKPGIIFGNVVTLAGGFFLGSQGYISWLTLLVTIIAMSLIIACGCIINNVIDRDIDLLMERTKNRVLAQGKMSGEMALSLAAFVGVIGFLIMYFAVNPLAALVAFIGFIVYVVIYSVFLKRKSSFGTTLGGIAGAMPPVVGYSAATNQFTSASVILFFILFLWQMPHFYAIAIYRLKDFAAAEIPVLPIKKGIAHTKIVMVLYIAVFTVVTLLPTLLGYIGWIYFIVALFLGLIWLQMGWKGLKRKDDGMWARKMFLFSIIHITILSLVMMT